MNPQVLIDIVTHRMPFGKYKGRLLCDIPEDYLVWMNKKGFPAGHLGMCLNTLYEIRLNGLEEIIREVRSAIQTPPEAKVQLSPAFRVS